MAHLRTAPLQSGCTLPTTAEHRHCSGACDAAREPLTRQDSAGAAHATGRVQAAAAQLLKHQRPQLLEARQEEAASAAGVTAAPGAADGARPLAEGQLGTTHMRTRSGPLAAIERKKKETRCQACVKGTGLLPW